MIGSNSANESDGAREALDPALLDRLVDGELAEADRRKLLQSLDHQPAGWRQCALAFLEAQSWCSLLGVGGAEEAAAETPAEPVETVSLAAAPTPASSPALRRLPRHWLWIGEMAASFLVAFSLGLWMRGGLTTTTTTTRSTGPFAVAPRSIDGRETRTVEVIAEGAGGQVEKMEVPLLDDSRAGWWQSQPAAVVPEEVRRAVERSGLQIRQERKYFPVQLPDGRRALVPIDQIDVVPAGNRGMQ
jgi:hypothetical protein